MKYLNRFSEFSKFKQINEAELKHLDTGGYNSGHDTFFANVQGNLAGAENTLVGSAVLKFVGFLKRKGVQYYLSSVLKPKLGKLYMNGILRYAINNDLSGIPVKEFFRVDEYNAENNTYTLFKNNISFINGEKEGLSAFEVGATIKYEKATPKLETGDFSDEGVAVGEEEKQVGKFYKLAYNNMNFSIDENGKINNIVEDVEIGEPISSETPVESEGNPVENTSEDKPLEETKPLENKNLYRGIETLVNELEIVLKNKTDNLSADGKIDSNDKKILTAMKNAVGLEKNELEKKLNTNPIHDKLTSDVLKNIGAERDYEVIIGSIKFLKEFEDKIQAFIDAHSAKNESKIHLSLGTFLNEATVLDNATNKGANLGNTLMRDAKRVTGTSNTTHTASVGRVGDELQKLAESGKVIDLNNPEFYDKFNSKEAKQGVTNEILTDVAGIDKIQLAAEGMIQGNKKLENAWKIMVNDVLSKYSKFMNTDAVNPYKLITAESRTKLANDTNGPVNQVKGVNELLKANENNIWTQCVSDLTDIKLNDYIILEAIIGNKPITTPRGCYIMKCITLDNYFKVFKLMGTIDISGISSDYNEKDFKKQVTLAFNNLLNPKSPMIGDKKLVGTYIVLYTDIKAKDKTDISLIFTYSNNGVVDANSKLYIRNKKTNRDEEVLSTSLYNDQNEYKMNMEIGTIKLKIKPSMIDKFVVATNQVLDNIKDKLDIIKNKIGMSATTPPSTI